MNEMKHKRTQLNPKIQVRESPISGKGMFAISDIAKGETIVVWGDCYTDSEGAEAARREGKGVMQWDDDVFSYECDDVNTDPFSINHSCDPNTWMSDAFTLVARRDIRAAEEITVDYALWEYGDGGGSWVCGCGSPLCRGEVTGEDWRDPVLQRRYALHFSPLVNKMIERTFNQR